MLSVSSGSRVPGPPHPPSSRLTPLPACPSSLPPLPHPTHPFLLCILNPPQTSLPLSAFSYVFQPPKTSLMSSTHPTFFPCTPIKPPQRPLSFLRRLKRGGDTPCDFFTEQYRPPVSRHDYNYYKKWVLYGDVESRSGRHTLCKISLVVYGRPRAQGLCFYGRPPLHPITSFS